MSMFEDLRHTLGHPKGRLVLNSLIYALGGFLPQALGVLLLPIFTSYLSPYDFGILSYTAMLGSFFSLIGSLSIQTYIIRHYYDCKTSQETKQLFGTIFIFVCGYNLLLLGVAFLTLPSIFRFFNIQVPFSPYVQLTLINTVMEIIGLIPLSYFRAKEQAGMYAGLAIAMTFLNGGLSVFLVVGCHMGLLGRYYGQLVADTALLVVYLIIIGRIAQLSWNVTHIRRALAFCLPLVPAQFLASFTSLADRAVLERHIPLGELGLYSVGFGLACGATVFTSGIYSAILPYVCKLASQSKLDTGILFIKRYFLMLVMVLMCAVIALSREIVTILASPAFLDSYKITSLLVMSILLQAFLTNVPSLYLLAAKKTQYESPIRFIGALVSLVSMLTLIPLWGIYGAGLSALVSALATLYGYRYILRRQSSVQWGFSRDVVMMGAAGLIGYGILQIQTPVFIMTTAVKLSVIGALVAIGVWRETGRVKNLTSIFGISRVQD